MTCGLSIRDAVLLSLDTNLREWELGDTRLEFGEWEFRAWVDRWIEQREWIFHMGRDFLMKKLLANGNIGCYTTARKG
jgi:hypothetical protein